MIRCVWQRARFCRVTSYNVNIHRVSDVADQADEDSRVRRLPVLHHAVLVRRQILVRPRKVAKEVHDLLMRGQVPREVHPGAQRKRHRRHQQTHDGRI